MGGSLSKCLVIESGFYYLQSRYYDPQIGRFLNADSYASTGQGFLGYNMFAYCGNNPVTGYDPAGTIPVGAIGSGIAGALVGLVSYLGSTNTPTIEGMSVAILSGAVSAIVGYYAGTVGEVAKLILSAVAGAISAISSVFTTLETGGDWEDAISSALVSFSTGTLTTYYGTYLDVEMFSGSDKEVATFLMTEFSGSLSIPLSVPFDASFDAIIDAFTYAPNYAPNYSSGNYWYTRKSSGTGIDPFRVVDFSF